MPVAKSPNTPKAKLPVPPAPVSTGKSIRTLEGTVLSAIRSARGVLTNDDARTLAKRIKGPSDAAVRDTVTPFAVDPHKMADLGRQAKQLLQSLKDEGLLAVETIRVHRKGQPDRRFQLEYSVDPQEPEAVIFRMRPASKADLGAEPAEMLTTQEVANRLNVSRPYVSKLVDQGVFKGIQLTQAGHRRIPAVEVLRVAADMRVSRRAALDEMEGLTADLRSKELEAARGAPKRGWVKQA